MSNKTLNLWALISVVLAIIIFIVCLLFNISLNYAFGFWLVFETSVMFLLKT